MSTDLYSILTLGAVNAAHEAVIQLFEEAKGEDGFLCAHDIVGTVIDALRNYQRDADKLEQLSVAFHGTNTRE